MEKRIVIKKNPIEKPVVITRTVYESPRTGYDYREHSFRGFSPKLKRDLPTEEPTSTPYDARFKTGWLYITECIGLVNEGLREQRGSTQDRVQGIAKVYADLLCLGETTYKATKLEKEMGKVGPEGRNKFRELADNLVDAQTVCLELKRYLTHEESGEEELHFGTIQGIDAFTGKEIPRNQLGQFRESRARINHFASLLARKEMGFEEEIPYVEELNRKTEEARRLLLEIQGY